MMTSCRPRLSALLLLTLSACLFSACPDTESSKPFDPTDLPEGTATEAWGIGDIWYKYTFSDHSVAPHPISWVVRTPDDDAYFMRIVRYYGDDGQSGRPTMWVARWNEDNQAFDEAAEWNAGNPITETRLCIDLDRAETVSCDGDYDVLWRTDRRPVPEIGFAPANPGLYVDTRNGAEVYQYQGITPSTELPTDEESISSKECAVEQSILEDDDATPPEDPDANDRNPDCDLLPWRVASAFDHDAQPLVPIAKLDDEHSVFQLTANLRIAQWHAAVNEADNTLTLQARCVYAPVENACAAPLEQPAQTLTLDLESAAQWTFVSLCDLVETEPEDSKIVPESFCGNASDKAPCVHHTQEDLRAGAWPDNRRFDLAIQTNDDDVHVWISPSQPITIEAQSMSENTTAPRSLWSIPGPEVCK